MAQGKQILHKQKMTPIKKQGQYVKKRWITTVNQYCIADMPWIILAYILIVFVTDLSTV